MNLRAASILDNHIFIIIVRSNTGRTPPPSSHSSRSSFDNHKERILKAIGDAQKSKSDARDIALFRDGYKCMLSGLLDIPSRKQSAQENDKNYAAAAFAMLRLFRLEGQAESILGGRVNDPQNILTLEYSLYRMFCQLDIWLEEVVNMPHTYDIIVPLSNQDEYNGLLHRPPSRVTFTITDDVLLKCKQHDTPFPALPDPKLIALRASCARVAHLSGAAEQMDQITRETGETTVLAEDGSSASLLGVLLGLQSNHVEDGA
ncbi:hypothetical protein DL96DRAFT_1708160 [Flagelloscypha sp. PMI_526]|nr:hypothetical protein DL96DRAFT_1708160 [Flagelloscypha sp. PMI_526]